MTLIVTDLLFESDSRIVLATRCGFLVAGPATAALLEIIRGVDRNQYGVVAAVMRQNASLRGDSIFQTLQQDGDSLVRRAAKSTRKAAASVISTFDTRLTSAYRLAAHGNRSSFRRREWAITRNKNRKANLGRVSFVQDAITSSPYRELRGVDAEPRP